jgi:hypothetical protein
MLLYFVGLGFSCKPKNLFPQIFWIHKISSFAAAYERSTRIQNDTYICYYAFTIWHSIAVFTAVRNGLNFIWSADLRLLCGAGGYPPNVLQPFETYCTNPAFSFPLSSQEALHVNLRERPLSAKGGTMGEKHPIKFSHKIATSTVIVGFFYMPQSCDVGPTALLPLRRKACLGFFRPKTPTASVGFEPANLGPRGPQANH